MIYLLLVPIILVGLLSLIWTTLLLPIDISIALGLLLFRKSNDKFVTFAIVMLCFALAAAEINSPF